MAGLRRVPLASMEESTWIYNHIKIVYNGQKGSQKRTCCSCKKRVMKSKKTEVSRICNCLRVGSREVKQKQGFSPERHTEVVLMCFSVMWTPTKISVPEKGVIVSHQQAAVIIPGVGAPWGPGELIERIREGCSRCLLSCNDKGKVHEFNLQSPEHSLSRPGAQGDYPPTLGHA